MFDLQFYKTILQQTKFYHYIFVGRFQVSHICYSFLDQDAQIFKDNYSTYVENYIRYFNIIDKRHLIESI